MFFLLPEKLKRSFLVSGISIAAKFRAGQGFAGRSMHDSYSLRLAVPQNPRCRGRLRLLLRYFRVVFRREIQQPLLGEGVGVFRETPAAFCLFF